MDITLQWRYKMSEQQLALVADYQPGYRAEIKALLPLTSEHLCTWCLYEQEQVLIEGQCLAIAAAQRLCTAMLKVALLLSDINHWY